MDCRNYWGKSLHQLHTKFYSTSFVKDNSACRKYVRITLVNIQNASVSKIVDSSSIQRAETKYGLIIQFLALVVMIHEVWLSA